MANQQQDTPLEYYRARYRQLDPGDVARRTGLSFDADAGRFSLSVLGFTVYADWPQLGLAPADDTCCPRALFGFTMQILAARFLIEGADAPSSGSFKAYRELPWGEVYNANFQGRCIKRLAFTFASKPEKFANAAEALGGVKLALGDVSYDLPFLGGVTCRLILWAPDEEFPPSAQFLFSDNTPAAFTAEDLAGVGDVVLDALKEIGGM